MKNLVIATLFLLFPAAPSAFGQVFHKDISLSEEFLHNLQQFDCALTLTNRNEEMSTIPVNILMDSNEVEITERSGFQIKLTKEKAYPRQYHGLNSVIYYCTSAILTMNWEECTDRYSFVLESKKGDPFPAVIEFYGCALVKPGEKIFPGAK